MEPLKPRDKVTQHMTRDGLTLDNQTTGESVNVSSREAEQEYTAQPEGAAEKILERADELHDRHKAKKAAKDAGETVAQATGPVSRLQFTAEERASPELAPYIKKAEKRADQLEAAKEALPKKRVVTKETVYDEAKGKAKSRLYFDKVEKSPPQLKPNPASRPIQEAGLYLHGKIHEVEHENVGVEGGHKGEELAERQAGRMIRSGVHRHKLKPYRAAAKAERKSIAANAEFAYQKSLRDNPELAQATKNPVSRFWQKQHIKREYAKAARAAGQTAQGAASTAKTTAAAAKKAAEKSRQAASFAARHWKGALIVGGVGLMLLLVMGGLQSCTAMFGSTGTGLAATSYLSEDSDMLGAEAAYGALEADLQHELDNYESLHPGYDEYRFDLDEIKHDPYVLTSILSALHNGVFTLGEVQGDLAMLFEKQYILTQTIETETRYRTETRTDSEGNTYTVEVPYTYYICNVKLENFDLSHLPIYILTEEQMGFYAAYMQTLGNRPDLFPNGSYPHASTPKEPTYYEIPPEALKDEAFAAMIAEAEKYVDYEAPAQPNFSIYQVPPGPEGRDFRYRSYEELQADGLSVDRKNYQLIYSAPLDKDITLDEIYRRFNMEHPADYKGHSLSMGDIVVFRQDGKQTAYYVDEGADYRQVPEFFAQPEKQLTPDECMTGEQIQTPRGRFYLTDRSREQMEAAGYGFHHQSEDGRYLIMANGTRAFAIPAQPESHIKTAEMSTEQNYNMIDGMMNNAPSMEELEARAKAGEKISLLDVAEATKAEAKKPKQTQKTTQKQKKPSIRAQLAAAKEEQKKKPPAREKSKEMEV